MSKEFYIHYGHGNAPRLTQRIFDVRIHELEHHRLGLPYTPTGYGDKLPTIYKVLVQGRWRRVYSRCHSNVSTEYVMLFKIVILSLTILTNDGHFSTELYVMPSFEKCVEVAYVVSDLIGIEPHDLTCQVIDMGEV